MERNSEDITSGEAVEEDTDKREKDESEVREPLTIAEDNVNKDIFKKPLLIIGPRRGKAVGKVRNLTNKPVEVSTDNIEETVSDADTNKSAKSNEHEDETTEDITINLKSTEVRTSSISPAQKIKENSIPLPYKEPKWGGIPKQEYAFEVLKNGKIVERNNLITKSFFVFGRLSTSDFHMAHPTISRYHAVLQYRSQESEGNPKGFYIYDLGSTHGTFLNKNRIKPNIYVRVQVGHMLKLGCSTRLFVLCGPEEDMEDESELTVTQLKEKRQQELAAREQEELEKERLEEERAKREEEQGVDWGMGEDADEETDLTENPFASTQNEELYINDPKKTLRGWFEREGYDLEYDVEEKGFGQFLCRVELPIENSRGGTMVAEALVKGKKKESVVQCALEACRMLDRYGLLRQATHESKKRKAKDWEAEDFYDSDEDTFLDRTGTVEKKRQQRMRAAGKKDPDEVVETYDSLVKKHKEVLSQLEELEREQLKVTMDINRTAGKQEDREDEEDALDAFMNELSKPAPDKKHLTRIKSQVAVLKQEEARLRKLVNIVKPANLPELKPPENNTASASTSTNKKTLPLVGSRRKLSNKISQTSFPSAVTSTSEEKNVESEEEEEEEEDEDVEHLLRNRKKSGEDNEEMETETDADDIKTQASSKARTKVLQAKKNVELTETENQETSEDYVKSNGDKEARTKAFGPARPPPPQEMEVTDSATIKGSKEFEGEIGMKLKVLGPSKASSEDSMEPEVSSSQDENKKKEDKRNRNKRRSQQRNEKAQQKSSEYDPLDPDYSTWVPPEGQTGDGRTKLNEKYGY